MKLHGNARTCPKSRRLLVDRLEGEWSLTEAAEAAGVSERTAAKWLARWRAEGDAGLQDRSSSPRRVPNRTPEPRVQAIAALRRLRMTGPEIAELLGMASSTVSAVLDRIGLGKLSRLEPPEPPNRYERARPGELLHVDVKKLVRIEKGAGHRVTGRRTRQAKGAGWEGSTSASMTPPASPTWRSWKTKRQEPRSASSSAPSPSTRLTGSPSRG